MKKIITYSSLLLALSLTVAGCRKDDPVEPDTTTDTGHDHSHHEHGGDVNVNLTHMVGSDPFQFNTNYTHSSGTVYNFSRAEFYVSGVALQDDNHVEAVSFNDTYHLISPNTTSFMAGTVEEGHYHSVSFHVGVDSAMNHADPTLHPSGHPLAPQNPSMHWGWSTGYKFLVLEGMTDTDGDGTPETAFTYHIGTVDLLESTNEMNIHTTVGHDEALDIALTIDYAAFLNGLDMTTDVMTHTANNLPLATAIAGNIAGAFSVQ